MGATKSRAARPEGYAMEMSQMDGKERDASPPAEGDVTEYQPINWKRIFFAPKYIPWWIVAILVVIATAIITVKHDEVVTALRPFSEKVRDLPAGWLIPIAILFVISFPPLFGHEIVALLCGVVYGLWIGFGIVCAGTFFGEIGTWFAFKYLLRAKAEKMERTNLNFASLARLTREGGFWIVFIIRFSAIPSHFSTAVFATCGVNFWFFAIATLLTLPKQLFLVYLGVLLLQQQPDGSAKNIVFGVAFVVTIIMAVYIYYKMRGCKKDLLDEQDARKHAQRMRKDSEAAAAGVASGSGGVFQQGAYRQEEALPLQGHVAAGRLHETTVYRGRTTPPYQAATPPYPRAAAASTPPEPPYPDNPSPAAEYSPSGYIRAYPQDQHLLQEQSRPPTASGPSRPVEGKSWV